MIDTTTTFGLVIYNLTQYVFGSTTVAGLWMVLLLFGVLSAMRIEFIVGVVLLLPITIVMMAYGFVPMIAGGLLLIVSALILAGHFFAK